MPSQQYPVKMSWREGFGEPTTLVAAVTVPMMCRCSWAYSSEWKLFVLKYMTVDCPMFRSHVLNMPGKNRHLITGAV